jgi:hypothetical protein
MIDTENKFICRQSFIGKNFMAKSWNCSSCLSIVIVSVPISFAWTSSQSGFFDLASIPSLGQSSIRPEGNAGIRTPHGSSEFLWLSSIR